MLVGQQDATHAVDEVRLRSDRLWMEGLTRAEAKRALEAALGNVIEPSAAALIAKHPAARNWLELIALADRCLAEAMAKGERRVGEESARAALGTAPEEAGDEGPAGERAVGDYLRGAAA